MRLTGSGPAPNWPGFPSNSEDFCEFGPRPRTRSNMIYPVQKLLCADNRIMKVLIRSEHLVVVQIASIKQIEVYALK